MHRIPLLGVVLAVACALGAGCAQMATQKKTVQMQDRTTAYRKAIRWGEYEIARPFVRRLDGTPFAYDADFYNQIKVVEMEIQNREVFMEEGIVRVTARIEFYHEDLNSVRTLVDRQTWWFDEETEQWYLEEGFPDYATALEN